ncbi:hypothetical protein BDP81DRAFT_439590 [Colletotrichum phormii]|uniref:Uncharacterized protein n=1 Tax=Colletotrichum phormii TaxID=359342 RepID=A0AAI9ZF80_9PEZI|nr:uncharacterized protein BDP81DRAFT_439590 [Colletotrichum phormii]KAK1623449.1 hypothetical protein BDP81DRAFT_439590 [Colletotrichum phormii]
MVAALNLLTCTVLDCCLCANDNFDLCQACYSNGSRCLSPSHDMALLQPAMNQDLSPETPIINLYPNWENETVQFVTRSQLSGGKYTLFGCDHCGEAIRQGNCYRKFPPTAFKGPCN